MPLWVLLLVQNMVIKAWAVKNGFILWLGRRAEKALEQTCKVSGCMFSSGCCGCPYGEQSAGRGGGRRNDQEGGLVGSEQLAAVRHPAGLLWTV